MKRFAGGALGLAAAITVVWMLMSRAGNRGSAEPPPRPEREAFAADRAVEFDGERAMGYLQAVCKLGPRISGSDGMHKQQELIKKHFEELGATVEMQRFTARQRSREEPVEMANLIVSWFPERPRRVILCTHYDTRPIADQERNRRDWDRPFISANDGGSGVALLMELGNQMRKLETGVGVDFVFFDGEEYIFDPGDGFARAGDKYFFGSEHFAREYRSNRPKYRYVAAVLFDMIAGKNAAFPIEQHSWGAAGGLVQELWKIAAQERCRAFVNQVGEGVMDDHLALNRVGIPAVDITASLGGAFGYPHWHRLSDTPENCSAAPMGQVAHVVVTWLTGLR